MYTTEYSTRVCACVWVCVREALCLGMHAHIHSVLSPPASCSGMSPRRRRGPSRQACLRPSLCVSLAGQPRPANRQAADNDHQHQHQRADGKPDSRRRRHGLVLVGHRCAPGDERGGLHGWRPHLPPFRTHPCKYTSNAPESIVTWTKGVGGRPSFFFSPDQQRALQSAHPLRPANHSRPPPASCPAEVAAGKPKRGLVLKSLRPQRGCAEAATCSSCVPTAGRTPGLGPGPAAAAAAAAAAVPKFLRRRAKSTNELPYRGCGRGCSYGEPASRRLPTVGPALCRGRPRRGIAQGSTGSQLQVQEPAQENPSLLRPHLRPLSCPVLAILIGRGRGAPKKEEKGDATGAQPCA